MNYLDKYRNLEFTLEWKKRLYNHSNGSGKANKLKSRSELKSKLRSGNVVISWWCSHYFGMD